MTSNPSWSWEANGQGGTWSQTRHGPWSRARLSPDHLRPSAKDSPESFQTQVSFCSLCCGVLRNAPGDVSPFSFRAAEWQEYCPSLGSRMRGGRKRSGKVSCETNVFTAQCTVSPQSGKRALEFAPGLGDGNRLSCETVERGGGDGVPKTQLLGAMALDQIYSASQTPKRISIRIFLVWGLIQVSQALPLREVKFLII